eukprot:gene21978-26386_t
MVELLWNKIEAVVEDVDDCRYDDEFVAVVGAEAERLKRELSVRESASGRFRFGKARFGITVTKGEFEAVCRDLVLQCHASVERVRRAAASLGAPPVARILMVGGSTRLPMIRDELNRMFDVPILIGDPDKVVAQGAARLAGRLAGSSAVHALSGGDRINSVLPRSIGLLIHSSAHPWREQPYVRHILKANTPLPVTKAATAVSTIFDNQDKVRIRLYEQAGAVESEDPADNRIIFDCEVSGLEKAPAGTEIKVLISVAVDGRLSVEMTDGRNRPLSMEAFMEGTLDEGEIVEQRQAVAGSAGTRSPNRLPAKTGCARFIDEAVEDGYSVGMLLWDHDVVGRSPLERSPRSARELLDSAQVRGNNDIVPCLAEAHKMLMERPAGDRVLAIFGDGDLGPVDAAKRAASLLTVDGIRIITCGLGMASAEMLAVISDERDSKARVADSGGIADAIAGMTSGLIRRVR